MPKIIPDLENRILATAAKHFEVKGYEATDMKTLAAELGISVGTLYNYQPSKPELFMAVSNLWKDELTAKLLAQLDGPDSAVVKLRTTLHMLYENMGNFTGLWKEFLSSGGKGVHGGPWGRQFKRESQELDARLQALFREVWKGHPNAAQLVNDPKNRLAQVIAGSIMRLVMTGEDDPEGTREFVGYWIDFLAPLDRR